MHILFAICNNAYFILLPFKVDLQLLFDPVNAKYRHLLLDKGSLSKFRNCTDSTHVKIFQELR